MWACNVPRFTQCIVHGCMCSTVNPTHAVSGFKSAIALTSASSLERRSNSRSKERSHLSYKLEGQFRGIAAARSYIKKRSYVMNSQQALRDQRLVLCTCDILWGQYTSKQLCCRTGPPTSSPHDARKAQLSFHLEYDSKPSPYPKPQYSLIHKLKKNSSYPGLHLV